MKRTIEPPYRPPVARKRLKGIVTADAVFRGVVLTTLIVWGKVTASPEVQALVAKSLPAFFPDSKAKNFLTERGWL
jgi:hypothetical protein